MKIYSKYQLSVGLKSSWSLLFLPGVVSEAVCKAFKSSAISYFNPSPSKFLKHGKHHNNGYPNTVEKLVQQPRLYGLLFLNWLSALALLFSQYSMVVYYLDSSQRWKIKNPVIIGPKAATSNQLVIIKNCKNGFISSLERAAMNTGYDVQVTNIAKKEA